MVPALGADGIAWLTDPARCARLVVKVGSSLLVARDGSARRDWLTTLAAEIADLRARGQELIVVSSGAIALGAARLGLDRGGRANLADAQASASVGQIALAGLWAEVLGMHDLVAAQLLLTLDDLEDRRRYLNVTATLGRLLSAGAVPVINENDSVATHEIRFGDNDRLAARVAQAARADGVLLLSDVDGLYDRNPRQQGARLIPLVRGVTPAVAAMADDGSASGMGSGGMTSKLQAAQIAGMAGIALGIVNGTHASPIARAAQRGTGTLFLPAARTAARKAWLGGRLRPKGTLRVDAGCAAALARGNSLLAAGVTEVSGQFSRGDLVAVTGPDGTLLAHGLSEYDAAECARLRGHSSSEHGALLGYAPRRAVIHRDQLAVFGG